MYDYGVMWINAKVNACGDACANPAVLLLWTIQGEGPWLLARVSGSTFYILLYYTFSAFWLWSSVVSVLISVTTDMTPTGVLLVTYFSLGRGSLELAQTLLCVALAWHTAGSSTPKDPRVNEIILQLTERAANEPQVTKRQWPNHTWVISRMTECRVRLNISICSTLCVRDHGRSGKLSVLRKLTSQVITVFTS